MSNLVVPIPARDEMLHSTLIAGFRLSAYADFPSYTKALFGPRPSDGRGWMPEYVKLCRYWSDSKAHGRAILHGSLLRSYFGAFMPPEVADADLMRSDADRQIVYSEDKPMRWNSCLKTPLRYCPMCVAVQMRQLDHSLWLRTHQLDGVEVCLHHGCKLHEFVQDREQPKLPHEVPEQRIESVQDRLSALWLAQESDGLLNANYRSASLTTRQLVMRTQALKLRYASSMSKVNLTFMAKHIGESLDPNFVLRVSKSKDISHLEAKLASVLLHDQKTVYPLMHLLCISVLFPSVEFFFKRVHGYEPDGNGTKIRLGLPLAEQRFVHRGIFNEQAASHCESTLTIIRQRYPRTFEWLLNNDQVWVKQQLARMAASEEEKRLVLRLRAKAIKDGFFDTYQRTAEIDLPEGTRLRPSGHAVEPVAA